MSLRLSLSHLSFCHETVTRWDRPIVYHLNLENCHKTWFPILFPTIILCGLQLEHGSQFLHPRRWLCLLQQVGHHFLLLNKPWHPDFLLSMMVYIFETHVHVLGAWSAILRPELLYCRLVVDPHRHRLTHARVASAHSANSLYPLDHVQLARRR